MGHVQKTLSSFGKYQQHFKVKNEDKLDSKSDI